MKYLDGKDVRVGDRVKLWNGCIGTVVASIDTQDYSEQFSEKDWKYLEKGILIETEAAGLIHYPEVDEKIELVL